jgi:hypothetical protein
MGLHGPKRIRASVAAYNAAANTPSASTTAAHCLDGHTGEKQVPWGHRQRIASTGLVPIAALLVGGNTGGWLAVSIGAPYPLGAILGGIAPFLASRAIPYWSPSG